MIRASKHDDVYLKSDDIVLQCEFYWPKNITPQKGIRLRMMTLVEETRNAVGAAVREYLLDGKVTPNEPELFNQSSQFCTCSIFTGFPKSFRDKSTATGHQLSSIVADDAAKKIERLIINAYMEDKFLIVPKELND